MRFLHIGVDNVFKFLEGFPHDMDILNVQEYELCILVLITLVASSCGLGIEKTLRLKKIIIKQNLGIQLLNSSRKCIFVNLTRL